MLVSNWESIRDHVTICLPTTYSTVTKRLFSRTLSNSSLRIISQYVASLKLFVQTTYFVDSTDKHKQQP